KKIGISQKELDELNSKLNTAYSSLYELSQTSTMELILQSQSLEEIISQTQYIQAIQTDLQSSIEKQNQIKAGLEKDKSEADSQKKNLETLSSQLSSSRSSLSSQKSQKDYLLDITQGEQAKYEQLLARIRSEASEISSDIYAARLAAGGFIGGGGTGGYPWAGSCGQVDPWLYYTCQCTSYAAWKFKAIHGLPFRNTRPGSGSAYNWPNLAHDQGYKVSSSPKIGDAVSWDRPLFPGDQWGHVAIVEQVYSSNDVVISEYNWKKLSYSVRRINPNNYGAPRYIRP
ncbi:MAG: CHAP domain-containing protein, partial [Patescibacteria group bacterium]